MPSIEDVKAVTEIMCDVTRDILWKPHREWALELKPDFELKIVATRGARTYHLETSDGNQAKIIYGQKMVEDKMSDSSRAIKWLSAKEINQRGYFNGVLEPAELLSHAMCREFARLMLCIKGRLWRGKVNSSEFYRLLDQLHHDGHAERVIDELRRRTGEKGLRLVFDQTVQERKFEFFESFSMRMNGKDYLATVMKISGNPQKIWVRLECPDRPARFITRTQFQLNRMLIAA